MRKSTIAILVAIVVLFLGFTGYTYAERKARDDAIAKIDDKSYIEGNAYNGNIADHLIGNKDAKVKIIEYADFQCPGCASTYPYIHDVVKEYGDKIAYIFRSYVLSYHQNGNAAASAANAASLQGYWEPYAEKLFEEQSTWEEESGSSRDDTFANYLTEVSGGKADIDKFKKDMSSSEVKDKISFDRKMSDRVNIQSTPAIYINGENLEVASNEDDFKKDLREKIDAALKD